jgi:hypothetical protein
MMCLFCVHQAVIFSPHCAQRMTEGGVAAKCLRDANLSCDRGGYLKWK